MTASSWLRLVSTMLALSSYTPPPAKTDTTPVLPAPVSVSVVGTWSGVVGDSPDPPAMRFVIAEDTNGAIKGRAFSLDPRTRKPLIAGDFTGRHEGASASWKSLRGLSVAGTFKDDHFEGTISFPAVPELGLPPLDGRLVLSRE